MRLRRMGWAGHVACLGEERKYQGFVGETQRKGTIQHTAQRVLSKQNAIAWGGLSWLRMERSGRLLVP
jgi:hypothetical protein